ncbi:heat shock 70 kDa protein 12A-like [Ruditapes philippinarum]|uniref:heat shock 70 kDa protein 12A-like n=1 Tax=Ruditapes philippinarum TaxID=129788 RepID=UPI00295A62DF|nr:heat shock 70 kDa protein 12A-like [Ruditapes philippinarum]
MCSVPVIAEAVQDRLQVAAIDFGTTYSGYAFSFLGDFKEDPLKIITNNWLVSSSSAVSLKTPSCILFDPEGNFHSFGFEAEDKYADLAADENHFKWFYFKRFKMLLYEQKKLTRDIKLKDDKGLTLSAMKVFSEGIRYLKDHLIMTSEEKGVGLRFEEVHWVLTVPAIWNDSAKQFMREAAIEAGIDTKHLSLALEPEAASLFCKYLPVEKVEGNDGESRISSFAPGKKYLVLDAGGGTVDITVHETQPDGTIRELYKANGGPWGGTKIDEAFQAFLEDVAGVDTMEIFMKDHKEDYLSLFREFEIKKKTFGSDLHAGQRITFRLPVTIHETYRIARGGDFRRSLMMKQDLQDQITFTGDKLRVQPRQVEQMFEKTCDKIVSHLKDIFSKPQVSGTEAILMVGGFSESMMLQRYIRDNFPGMRIIIPEDAGLAVLKGAVIFGHNPKAIVSRAAKYTYGIRMYKTFDRNIHPESKKVILDGVEKCDYCFDIHVTEGQEVQIGEEFGEKSYVPSTRSQTKIALNVYTSDKTNPLFVDESGCTNIGKLDVDMSDIEKYEDRNILVKMKYGDTELGVEAKIVKTSQILKASLNFLG